MGLPAASVADRWMLTAGFVGAAQSLLMLANVLDQASPGDVVVVRGIRARQRRHCMRATDAVWRPDRRAP